MAIMKTTDVVSQRPVTYACGNCGRAIGALEQPYQWGDAIVCPQCCQLLQQSSQAYDPAPADALNSIARSLRTAVARSQAKRVSNLGITSLILGLLAFCTLTTPLSGAFSTVGLVFGIVGLVAANAGKETGRGLPWAGIIVCTLAIVTAFSILMTEQSRLRSQLVANPPLSAPAPFDTARTGGERGEILGERPRAASDSLPRVIELLPSAEKLTHLPQPGSLNSNFDHAAAIISTFGNPDRDQSNEDQNETVTYRWLTYRKVKISLKTDPARAGWWIVSRYSDTDRNELTADEAESRLRLP